MKSFWSGFLNAVLNGALQGGAAASQQGADIKNTGITAGVGAIAGILQYLTTHPVTASPTNAAAITAAQTTTKVPA